MNKYWQDVNYPQLCAYGVMNGWLQEFMGGWDNVCVLGTAENIPRSNTSVDEDMNALRSGWVDSDVDLKDENNIKEIRCR